MNINIKVGDKVIDSYGKQGKIIDYEIGNEFVKIEWETGAISHYLIEELENYYLVGDQVIDNKCSESELLKQLEKIDSQIEKLQKKKRQLKKQFWRLREVMVPDWKEQQQNRKKLTDSED